MAGVRGRSGRKPKTLEQHERDGTFRWDRHAHLLEADRKFSPPPKPTARVVGGDRDSGQWCRSESDERAVRNGYRFNEALANHFLDFCRKHIQHSKGEWAGQPFEATDWQRENIFYPIFGWVDQDGLRRFRRTYIEIPKKNYKSTSAAAVGVYMLCGDEEPGAEIYSLGADKDQARVVHNEAISMVEASEALAEVVSINRSTYAISYKKTNSVYRALSASPRGKHGINIHCAIADELHEWHGDELWNAIRFGFRARRQPLLFVITNAGDDTNSICYKQREYAQSVLSGYEKNDRFLALICAVPREEADRELQAVLDGADTLPVARKCNPGLGHVIKEQNLVEEIREAAATPGETPNLLRLTYGVWAVGSEPWLDHARWNACKEDFGGLLWDGSAWTYSGPLDDQTCWAALDLSKNRDLTAFALAFPDGEIVRQLVAYWMPEDTAEERRHLFDYLDWARAGFVRLLPGQVIDYAELERDLLQIAGLFDVREILYDPWQAEPMRQRLYAAGYECVKFEQSARNFSSPTEDFERLLLDGKLRHSDNRLLNWQASHVEVKVDVNKNKRPVKRKPGDPRTVDGIVAAIMALAGALKAAEETNYYDEHELEVA